MYLVSENNFYRFFCWEAYPILPVKFGAYALHIKSILFSPHRSIGINTPMIQTPGHFGMFKPVESDDIYARGQRLADFQSDMFNDVNQEQQMMMADDSSLLGPRSVVQTENDKEWSTIVLVWVITYNDFVT